MARVALVEGDGPATHVELPERSLEAAGAGAEGFGRRETGVPRQKLVANVLSRLVDGAERCLLGGWRSRLRFVGGTAHAEQQEKDEPHGSSRRAPNRSHGTDSERRLKWHAAVGLGCKPCAHP